jgi:hypothetical protein
VTSPSRTAAWSSATTTLMSGTGHLAADNPVQAFGSCGEGAARQRGPLAHPTHSILSYFGVVLLVQREVLVMRARRSELTATGVR